MCGVTITPGCLSKKSILARALATGPAIFGFVMATKRYTTLDIEVILMEGLGIRTNTVVPNVSWGLDLNHECDLLSVTPAGWATEYEIKVSKSDLLRDKEKKHGHRSDKIKQLYFVIPYYLEDCIDEIQQDAGVIVIDEYGHSSFKRDAEIRKGARALESYEILKLARLGTMRILGLKKALRRLKQILKVDYRVCGSCACCEVNLKPNGVFDGFRCRVYIHSKRYGEISPGDKPCGCYWFNGDAYAKRKK
jgi:hypothetical protein